MAEVLEYSLVVLLSTVLTVFSVGVYGSLSAAVGPATDEADFASVVALANAAVEHGVSSSALVFDHARIRCEAGTITLAADGYSQNASLPVGCSVPWVDVSGARQLTFNYSASLLTLQVR